MSEVNRRGLIKWLHDGITVACSPCGSDGKESACNAGDPGSIPGLGRSPGEGNGNPLQYSCLENLMDRGAWRATVHGVTKSRTWLSDFTFHFPLSFLPHKRCVGEGNGNPLQYSCLENHMDGGAWWATVHWVAKSQTQLSMRTHACSMNFNLLWGNCFTVFSKVYSSCF